jgi:DNA polymerase-1
MNALKNFSESKTTLLVDGDLYLYRSCAAVEVEVEWDEDLWSLHCDLAKAKKLFSSTLEKFMSRLGSTQMLLCFTQGHNFRKDVLPTYKGGRKKTRKPVGYLAAVEWAKEEYPSYVQDGLEADDVMGILQSVNQQPTCIVSDDKDLKTIPGKLYRPMADELLDISESAANLNFYMQCLTGDSTDGYLGLKGCGPKTAEKLLGNHPSWEQVAAAYDKAGISREDAIIQSRCARILRSCDWDWETETIKLWEPGRC